MKKITILLIIGAVALIYSCGPRVTEIADKVSPESMIADSLALIIAHEQRIADS